MYMVMFVLHDSSYLRQVIQAWETAGVCGITVLPSTGLRRMQANDFLREDVPLIMSLADLVQGEETSNRTLITFLRDESNLDTLVAATQDIVGDLNQPDTGILAVMPVIKAYGLDRKADASDPSEGQ